MADDPPPWPPASLAGFAVEEVLSCSDEHKTAAVVGRREGRGVWRRLACAGGVQGGDGSHQTSSLFLFAASRAAPAKPSSASPAPPLTPPAWPRSSGAGAGCGWRSLLKTTSTPSMPRPSPRPTPPPSSTPSTPRPRPTSPSTGRRRASSWSRRRPTLRACTRRSSKRCPPRAPRGSTTSWTAPRKPTGLSPATRTRSPGGCCCPT